MATAIASPRQGILNGPGTGRALAALILDGPAALTKEAAVIAPLSPKRYSSS